MRLERTREQSRRKLSTLWQLNLQRSSSLRHRCGFSLLELLVVIVIIVILIALLLPNIQGDRELTRRRQCADKMRELGLAFQKYVNANDAFPAGTLNPDGPIRNLAVGEHVSWTVQSLPFMGLQELYDRFDVSVGTYAEENRSIRMQTVSQLICPASPEPPTEAEADDETGLFPHSNYAGCHHHVEAPIAADNQGMLFLNSAIHLNEIKDGAGKTILLGEIPPEPGLLGWASGTRATLRNTSNIMNAKERQLLAFGDAEERDPLEVGGFGSFHVDGMNTLFVSGSVDFITEDIDPQLLQELGNRSDSQADLDVDLGEMVP